MERKINKNGLLNQYAMKDSVIVHINDVTNGLSCGCLCPSCNGEMIAKQGSVMSHHFSHKSQTNCLGGLETILHKLGKKILLENMSVFVPCFDIQVTRYDEHGKQFEEGYKNGIKKVDFVYVEDEVRFSGFTPDIVAEHQNSDLLFVEIKVSHEVDEIKKEKVRKTEHAMFEIDLSYSIQDIQLLDDEEALKQYILRDAPRYWISNIKQRNKKSEIISRIDKLVDDSNNYIIEKEKKAKQIEDEDRENKRIKNIEIKNLKEKRKTLLSQWKTENATLLKELGCFNSQSEKDIREKKLHNQADYGLFWSEIKARTNLSPKELPLVFTQRQCDFNYVFNVPEEVWEVGVYDKFIHRRPRNGYPLQCLDILKWCVETYGLTELLMKFWHIWFIDIANKENIYEGYLSGIQKRPFENAAKAIDLYLSKLQEYHFLGFGHQIINNTVYYAEASYTKKILKDERDKEIHKKLIEQHDIAEKKRQEEAFKARADNKTRSLQLAMMEAWSRNYNNSLIMKCSNCNFVYPLSVSKESECPFCCANNRNEYTNNNTPIKSLYKKYSCSVQGRASLNVVFPPTANRIIHSLISYEEEKTLLAVIEIY